MEKVIYLEPDDEITMVIDKIRKITQERVILVVPKAATILQSIVNLKILKKEALRMGKHISIVTSDETGRNLAIQIGLDVYRDLAKRPLPESEKLVVPKKEEPTEKEKSQEKTKRAPVVFPIPSKKDKEFASIREEMSIPETKSRKPQAVIDIGLSRVKFKPYKDESRAGLGRRAEKQIKTTIKAATKPKNGSLKKLKTTVIILAVFILLMAAAVYFLLPKAGVNLILKVEKMDKNLEITAQKGASENSEASLIPAEVLEVEKETSKDFSATGIKDVGEKAKGTITIFNETGVDQPLVAQTRFQSTNGLIFRSSAAVTVPKAYLDPSGEKINGSVKVSVIADAVGEAYNIGPSNFKIPGLSSSLQNKIYGRSEAAMTGGLTRKVKIVSDKDVLNAQTELLNEIIASGEEEIKAKTNQEEEMIIPGSTAGVVVASNSVPVVGAEAENFKYTLKAKAVIMTVKKNDFYGLIEDKINHEIAMDKELLTDELEKNTTFKVISLEVASGKMVVVAEVHAPVVAKMDTQVIKDNLKNKSPNEGVAYLKSFEEVYDVQISLWPFYARRIPVNTKRVNINTSYHL